MIHGRAMPEGTKRYSQRFDFPADHWRNIGDLTVGSIGMGSYLGQISSQRDMGYSQSTKLALKLGCNLIDSAINYRFQRSERSIGVGLGEAIKDGIIKRDEVVICTKGGFVPYDTVPPHDPVGWFKENMVEKGIASINDLVANCHCMTPKYINNQIETSLKNLGIETIDVYYLHNPEMQLTEVGRDQFEDRIADAFQTLEKAVSNGMIQMYGTATWNGYRIDPRNSESLSLSRLVDIAKKVGGPSGHHFKMVQLPYNLAMLEAIALPTQIVDGQNISVLDAAKKLDVSVVTSVPLLQTRLFSAIPPAMYNLFEGITTNPQRCIQFVRSTPGIVAPLIGMSTPSHVEENLYVAKVKPMSADKFDLILMNKS